LRPLSGAPPQKKISRRIFAFKKNLSATEIYSCNCAEIARCFVMAKKKAAKKKKKK
jgi:hypothetical protein